MAQKNNEDALNTLKRIGIEVPPTVSETCLRNCATLATAIWPDHFTTPSFVCGCLSRLQAADLAIPVSYSHQDQDAAIRIHVEKDRSLLTVLIAEALQCWDQVINAKFQFVDDSDVADVVVRGVPLDQGALDLLAICAPVVGPIRSSSGVPRRFYLDIEQGIYAAAKLVHPSKASTAMSFPWWGSFRQSLRHSVGHLLGIGHIWLADRIMSPFTRVAVHTPQIDDVEAAERLGWQRSGLKTPGGVVEI